MSITQFAFWVPIYDSHWLDREQDNLRINKYIGFCVFNNNPCTLNRKGKKGGGMYNAIFFLHTHTNCNQNVIKKNRNENEMQRGMKTF